MLFDGAASVGLSRAQKYAGCRNGCTLAVEEGIALGRGEARAENHGVSVVCWFGP